MVSEWRPPQREVLDVSAYWMAAGMLIACQYCKAEPFTPCRTVIDEYGPTQQPKPTATHARRTYAGHAVLRQMLETGGAKRIADRDCPPQPPVTYEDVFEIVREVLAQSHLSS